MSSKKHHFVPRSWLKHFSFGRRGKQVCVSDKKRGSSHCSSIADAGAENHFNTAEIGGRRVVFEGLFQECDDRLAPIIGKLIRHERLSVLSDEDRATLAHIAVIQLFRVNMQMTTIVEMTRNIRRMLREHGQPELVDPSPEAEDNEARQMALELLKHSTKFVPHFLERNWCLFRAPNDAELDIRQSGPRTECVPVWRCWSGFSGRRVHDVARLDAPSLTCLPFGCSEV